MGRWRCDGTDHLHNMAARHEDDWCESYAIFANRVASMVEVPHRNVFVCDFNYSDFKLFTGLAIADWMAWMEIVRRAITMALAPARINIHQDNSIL
jgi:hypothetical protein